MATETSNSNLPETDVIDIGAVMRKIWRGRYFLLKCAAAGFIIALIVIFSTPKEYVSQIQFTHDVGDPTLQSPGISSISVLGLSNVNQGVYSVPFNTDIYPLILNSRPFLKDLLFTHLDQSGKFRIYDYIENDIRSPWWKPVIGFPRKIIGFFRTGEETSGEAHDIDTYGFSPVQQMVADELASRIQLNSNSKTNVITLTVRTQEPLYSLQIADSVFVSLQDYIIDYKTDKAWSDYEFALQTFEQAKQEYLEAQHRYASFIDKNQNIFQQSTAAEKDFLQNEMYLAYRVYDQASQGLSAARIKVQENTPVFVVIEPASLPQLASAPKKTANILLFVFLALVVGVCIIIFSESFRNFFRSVKDEQEAERDTGSTEC